jgi:hypothetical protein
VVYDARYWREQAVLSLEIARQLSDRRSAEQMRVNAAEYFARATELEKRAAPADRPGVASTAKP